MAQTIDQVVETHLKVIDQSTGPLAKIARNAEHMSGILGDLAGVGLVVGGALSLHAAIQSTEEYMKKIKQVTDLTGATASETDFLFSSAARVGVEYDAMQRTMFMLSRRGAMLEQTMAAATNHVPGMAQKFARLGITVDKGPVKALESMARAVKAGKLHAGDLMAQLRVPPAQATQMEHFLKTLDPKKLAMARKGKGGYLQESDLDAFKKLEEAHHRISDTWNRIKVTVLSKLFPIAASMAEKLADRLEAALPKIQSAMQFVADHMDQIVNAAKVFVGLMTAKKMLGIADKLMGGTGLITGGKALVENIAKAVPLLGKLGMAASRAAMGGVMANANAVGATSFLSPALLTSIGSASAAFTILAAVLAAVVAVVGVGYLAFKAFQTNFQGVTDRLASAWDHIKARFEMLWDTLQGIGDSIARLFGGEGSSLGQTIGYLAALSFDFIVEQFDDVIHVFQTVVSMGSELADMIMFVWKDVLHDPWKEYVQDPFMQSMKFIADGVGKVVGFLIDQYNMITKFWGGAKVDKDAFKLDLGWMDAPVKMFAKHWAKTQMQTDQRVARNRAEDATAKKRPEDTRPPNPYNDFRGSRFDITQNFAEGFDPDRIATAFSSDLSNLGEMRMQSGFAPAAVVR